MTSAGTTTRSPGETGTLGRSSVLKPSIVTRTVYVSPSAFGKVKLPFSLVLVSTDVPREALMSTTVAPGITAPEVSRTDPNTEPLVTCATAVVGAIHMTTKEQKRRML